MRRYLALLVVLMLPLQSGCTLLFGDRMSPPGTGGNGGSGGVGVSGGGGAGGGGSCVPVRCADAGAVCGAITDGCGSTLACGSCPSGETCGGGGANRCGTNACVPQTCAQLGASCGQFSDGCAGVVDCGPCACTPTTCAAAQASCGNISDGCGHTLDCGTCPAGTWQQLGSFVYNFVSVTYNSTSGVWIADDLGHVLHSTDDVQFTTEQLPGTIATLYAQGDEVFAGGSNGIFHKAPGTTTFTLVPPSPGSVTGIHGAGGVYYAITYENTGAIYRSLDGVSWGDVTPTPFPGQLRGVFAVSPLEAWVVGSGGAVYHTTDAGSSWTKKSLGTTVDVYSVWATSSLVVIAASSYGLLRSADQGATWSRTPNGSDHFYSVSGSGPNDLWAAGSNTSVMHSTDGGVTWTHDASVTGGAVLDSVYAATDREYIVGEYGALGLRKN
jgi:hypothetical protein